MRVKYNIVSFLLPGNHHYLNLHEHFKRKFHTSRIRVCLCVGWGKYHEKADLTYNYSNRISMYRQFLVA